MNKKPVAWTLDDLDLLEWAERMRPRVDSVLALPGQEDNPGTDWLDRDEVHRLLTDEVFDLPPCRGVTCVHPCGDGPCQWQPGDETRLQFGQASENEYRTLADIATEVYKRQREAWIADPSSPPLNEGKPANRSTEGQ